MQQPIVIRRFLDVAGSRAIMAAIDAIFFEASHTKTFESEAVRAAFRERWLGQYLVGAPEWAYVALAGADEEVVGYLVGMIEQQPACAPGPSSVPRALLAHYPAHLHVNVARGWRGAGIGARLVARFAGDVAAAGARGVHLVTGAGARNVGFYQRNGFQEVARIGEDGALVVLARALTR
jgi:ribosomal protein S18 acetylase RimI-like enzyme